MRARLFTWLNVARDQAVQAGNPAPTTVAAFWPMADEPDLRPLLTQWSEAGMTVALPVVRPGLWITCLFSLLLAYNEFLFALVLTGPNTKTLPVAIAEYGAEDLNYWSLSAAAAIGIMLPIVLFMVALQRHLVRGLAFGAVKG